MDGSHIAEPEGISFSSLSGPDALFRVVYYGEALRAMTEHVSDTFISGPCAPVMALLDDAFDRFSSVKESFCPEEFTLYVMSLMLNLCDDAEEARQFRIGSARYIVRAADRLPKEYGSIVSEARNMLRGSDRPEAIAAPVGRAPASAERRAARPQRRETPSDRRPAPSERRIAPAGDAKRSEGRRAAKGGGARSVAQDRVPVASGDFRLGDVLSTVLLGALLAGGLVLYATITFSGTGSQMRDSSGLPVDAQP